MIAQKLSPVRWFTGFGIYVLAMVLLALWAGAHGRDALRNLVYFITLVSFACQFCPIPIIPAFLAISRDHNPVLIALLGSCATSIANLHDYYILTSLMRWDRLARAKETHWYSRAVSWFGRYPFWTLAVANTLPLPIDVPRLLAISTGYSRLRFTLATFVGRVPRYLLLAWLGYELKLSNKAILIVLAAVLALSAAKTVPNLLRKRHNER